MRILGIDPGLQTTGFGVVDVDGHSAHLRGQWRHHPPRNQLAWAACPRLKVLFDGIGEVAARQQSPMWPRWRSSSMASTRSPPCCWARRAAPALPLVARDLPVAEYTALQ